MSENLTLRFSPRCVRRRFVDRAGEAAGGAGGECADEFGLGAVQAVSGWAGLLDDDKIAPKGGEVPSRERVVRSPYKTRLVPTNGAVTAEWARLLGAKDKNQRDRALAPTARGYGFVLVTRNIDDVRGCNVQVLNPFKANPVIESV
jgi:hypothetical protein